MIREFLYRLYGYVLQKIRQLLSIKAVKSDMPIVLRSDQKYANQQEMARRWRF